MMLRSSLVTNLLALFCLLYVLCSNLASVSAITMPERAYPPGDFLGLNQSWVMFAPSPPQVDGWYVIPGTLRGGRQVDLMPVTRGDFGLHRVSWDRPRYLASTYENSRWRKYMEHIREEEYTDQRLYLGRYICREWNARHAGAEQLMTFHIIYIQELTLPDYQRASTEEFDLWEHHCF